MVADPLAHEPTTAAGQAPTSGQSLTSARRQRLFWLALAIAVALGFGLRASRPALVNPTVIHDDVRQHVFWVPRLHDPALFAGDWIADYYQSQAPSGYLAVYWLVTLAVDAVLASKLLPLVLTVALAVAAFWLGWALWRRADAATLGAVLLAWSVWHYDDVASATPRAYALPLLAVQLAALASRRWWLALAVLPVQALLYPLGCAVPVVTIGLWTIWQTGGLRAAIRPLMQLGAVTLVALALVGLEQLDTARYGPTVSAETARTMSEFQQGGRAAYFVSDPYRFWIESSRSGFALGPKDTTFESLPALTLPFVLAALLGGWVLLGRLGWRVPPAVPARGALLLVLLLASLLLFVAAHVLLFALYLPARHVQFSLPLVWALAGGLCWALLGEQVAAWCRAWMQPYGRIGLPANLGLTGAEAFSLAGIALLALHPPPPGDFYVTGRQPAIYAYLRETPPGTLVGALPADSNILPILGQRGILTTYEHALPYHPGYYEPLRERTEAFRAAYYAPTLAPLAEILAEQGVGVVIADTDALERRRRAERESPPALEGILDRCGVLRERELVVIPAACIRAAAEVGR